MEKITLAAAMLLSAGCTTFEPLGASSAAAQERIYSGELGPRDEVEVVTRDGSRHELRLTRVDTEQGLLVAESESIPIDEVVTVEKRIMAPAKTGGLVLGVIMFLMAGGG